MADHPQVAFIGLGTMGAPMASNLQRAGIPLAVFDVAAPARVAFEGRAGVRVARSPADAAEGADIVVTMLPNSSHVHDALFGADGAALVMRPNGLVMDMGTGAASATLKLAAELDERGLRFVDVPVARGRQEAIDGRLIAIAGGAEADIAEVRPLLQAMAEQILHVGPVGNGIRAKLVNNYGAMLNMVVAGELLAFAAKLDLDRGAMLGLLTQTPAGKGQLVTNFPRKVLAGDVTPDFPLLMGLKDISLALELAGDVGMPLWLGAAARELYSLSRSRGRAQDDCSAMLLLIEDLAGVVPG